MTISPIDMQNTRMQMGQQEIQSQSQQIAGLQNSKLDDAAKDKKLREACQGFESIFIQKMWEQMRATVPESSFMHGKEEKFWQGMYDQELAKHMASAGGIGLADMMYEQMTRSLVSASRTTASSKGGMDTGSGFTAQAAPLVPEAPKAAPATPAAPQAVAAVATPTAASMYSGAAEQPQAPSVEISKPNEAQPAQPVMQSAQAAQPSQAVQDDTPMAVRQALANIQQNDATHTPTAAINNAQQAREMAAARLPNHAVLPRQNGSTPHTGTTAHAAESMVAANVAAVQMPTQPVQAAAPVQPAPVQPASAEALHDVAAALLTQGPVGDMPLTHNTPAQGPMPTFVSTAPQAAAAPAQTPVSPASPCSRLARPHR